MRKGRKAMKGKRSWLGKKKTRFADVHSFKLTGAETRIFSAPDGSTPQVLTSGPNVGIGNIALSGAGAFQVARYAGVAYMAAVNTTQWTQLNTLFDRYKIHGVKYTFIPEFNVAQTSGSGVLPVIKFVHDYDDAIVPTVGDVWSRQGKVYRFNKPISVYVKPKILLNVLQSGAAGYWGLAQKSQYLNTAFGNIPHVGLKFAVKDWSAPNGLASVVCRIETTYYMTLREQLNTSAVGHDGDEPALELPEIGVAEDGACELKPPPM